MPKSLITAKLKSRTAVVKTTAAIRGSGMLPANLIKITDTVILIRRITAVEKIIQTDLTGSAVTAAMSGRISAACSRA